MNNTSTTPFGARPPRSGLRSWIVLLHFLLTFVCAGGLRADQFGDFSYSSDGSAITIYEYTGPGGAVAIPATIAGLPVTTLFSIPFYNKTTVTSVTIPSGVTVIGEFAFYGCTGMTTLSVDVSNTVYSSLDGVLFNKSQTTLVRYPGGKAGSYTIPSGVTSIRNGAFKICTGLTDVTIPPGVTCIGDMFTGCTGLTNVTIPTSVPTIGIRAFFQCTALTNVTIPSSVTSIPISAFSQCTGLTTISVDVSNTAYSSFDGGCSTRAKPRSSSIPVGKTAVIRSRPA